MSEDESNLPSEIIRAYREAKARGLPDGWTCSIDVSKGTCDTSRYGYCFHVAHSAFTHLRNCIAASGWLPTMVAHAIQF